MTHFLSEDDLICMLELIADDYLAMRTAVIMYEDEHILFTACMSRRALIVSDAYDLKTNLIASLINSTLRKIDM